MTGVLRTRDEEGAALIIGLVVLMSFGLIIGSLMSLGGTSLIATSALRDQRAQIYAAEAAIDEEATRLELAEREHVGNAHTCSRRSHPHAIHARVERVAQHRVLAVVVVRAARIANGDGCQLGRKP